MFVLLIMSTPTGRYRSAGMYTENGHLLYMCIYVVMGHIANPRNVLRVYLSVKHVLLLAIIINIFFSKWLL